MINHAEALSSNKELLAITLLEEGEMLSELKKELEILDQKVEMLKTNVLFEEEDANNAFLEIHAGAGGVESYDWSKMLMRMYLRFAETMNYKTEINNIIEGEETGIKSCSIKIKGAMSYGWLKHESGVHRLVRISPFNALGKRMTSFASVWIYPEIKTNNKIKIEDQDIKIDRYRSSGAGGQHVNTTDSAIRITHLKTNIVVQCQNQRSQHQNKVEAMKMLISRLTDLEKEKDDKQTNKKHLSKGANAWSNHIRSYILQPYQMIKDLRTGFSTSDSKKILNGDLKKMLIHNLYNLKNT